MSPYILDPRRYRGKFDKSKRAFSNAVAATAIAARECRGASYVSLSHTHTLFLSLCIYIFIYIQTDRGRGNSLPKCTYIIIFHTLSYVYTIDSGRGKTVLSCTYIIICHTLSYVYVMDSDRGKRVPRCTYIIICIYYRQRSYVIHHHMYILWTAIAARECRGAAYISISIYRSIYLSIYLNISMS